VKAILLAAGLGSRLGNLTSNIPKCLLKVSGITMLDHWIYKLNALGVTEFLINTHYLADKVTQHFQNHGLRKAITLVNEPELLGTAGTILANSEFITEDTFVVHADNVCQDNLNGMIKAHINRPKQCIMTLLTFETAFPKECGIITKNNKDIMVGFQEKPSIYISSLANGAVYIVTKDFKNYLKNLGTREYDLSKNVLPNLLNKVFCYHTTEFFMDIGTIRGLKAAERHIRNLPAKNPKPN